MIEYIKGDILQGIDGEDRCLILHGCNCFHTMGAGIALYLRKKYPQVLLADINKSVYGDRKKLGTYTKAVISEDLQILNCYTQYRYWGKGPQVDYDAIEKVFWNITYDYSKDCVIRMPQIGCGLAGGDWKKVEKLVKKHLTNFHVKVYSL